MSRLSKSKSTTSMRSQVRAPPSPTKSLMVRDFGPAKARGTPARPVSKSPTKQFEEPAMPDSPKLSVKEQIALKRAEAKKAQLKRSQGPSGSTDCEANEVRTNSAKVHEDDLTELGRVGVRETVNRARSTGACRFASASRFLTVCTRQS